MQKNHLGLGLIVTLVALRVVTGMHFFREGINKVREPKSFSGGFFSAAKGPFAPLYYNLVWDRDGLARLNLKGTLDHWDQFRAQIEKHYGFDDAQKARAQLVNDGYEAQLKEFMAGKSDDIREYRGNLTRLNQYANDRQRLEVPSLLAQNERIESDIRSKKPTLMTPIDAMWRGYSRDMNAIATRAQRARGTLPLNKPARRPFDSETIDTVIPWFDIVIGVLLITGFLTRPAALLGGAFLLSVAVSQWPWAEGSIPSWPQLIEAIGLMVVAAAGAGRYFGIDSVFAALRAPRVRS